MNDKINEVQGKLESRIERLNISSEGKDRMKRALEGIMKSPNGRLYFEKQGNFQEYLTLRKNEFTEYEFCIVRRVIDEMTGKSEETQYDFPTLPNLAELIEQNKDKIESEITSAENYQRLQGGQTKSEDLGNDQEKTPKEIYTERAKQNIEDSQDIHPYKKQRAMDVLDEIAASVTAKFCAERGSNYTEAIELRQNRGELGYYIVSTMFDEYTGGKANRRTTPISVKGLVDYIDEHKVEIDKEMKRLERQHTKKPGLDMQK